MKILAQFLQYAWDLGMTVEFGDFVDADKTRIPVLRLQKDGRRWQQNFRDIAHLEKHISGGWASYVACEMCVPKFKVTKDKP